MITVSINTCQQSKEKTLKIKEFSLPSPMGSSLVIGYEKVNFHRRSITLMSL